MALPDFIRRRLYGRTLSEQRMNAEDEAWAAPRGKGASAKDGKDGIARDQFAAKRLQELGYPEIRVVDTHDGGDIALNPLGRDEQYDHVAPGWKYDQGRRAFLRKAVILGGAAGAVAFGSGILVGRSQASPGGAINGPTLTSSGDIDAKRIGGVRQATEFDTTSHAGTSADPFTGTAINAALADLPTFGGIVALAGVNFLDALSHTPPSVSRLMGMGAVTVVKRANAANTTLFDCTGKNSVSFCDFTIDGNQANQTTNVAELLFLTSNDSLVSRMVFVNSRYRAIDHDIPGGGSQCLRFLIDACSFYNCLQDAIFISGKNGAVTDCIFYNVPDTALDIGGFQGNWYATDVAVAGCAMIGCASSVTLARGVAEISVVGNSHLSLNNGDNFLIADRFTDTLFPVECLVSDNVCTGVGAAATSYGMKIVYGSRIALAGNVVRGFLSGYALFTNATDIEVVGGIYALNSQHGAVINGSRIRVAGGRYINNGQGATLKTGIIVSSATDVTLDGPTCEDTQGGSATQNRGVEIDSSTRTRIIRAVLRNNLTYGVFFGDTGSTLTDILDNYFLGNATSALSSDGSTTGLTRVMRNVGLNPLGYRLNCFDTTNNLVTRSGSASAPVASTDYIVQTADAIFTVGGQGAGTITIKDPGGLIVLSGVTTLNAVLIPQGYKINFGAFGGTPPTTLNVFFL